MAGPHGQSGPHRRTDADSPRPRSGARAGVPAQARAPERRCGGCHTARVVDHLATDAHRYGGHRTATTATAPAKRSPHPRSSARTDVRAQARAPEHGAPSLPHRHCASARALRSSRRHGSAAPAPGPPHPAKRCPHPRPPHRQGGAPAPAKRCPHPRPGARAGTKTPVRREPQAPAPRPPHPAKQCPHPRSAARTHARAPARAQNTSAARASSPPPRGHRTGNAVPAPAKRCPAPTSGRPRGHQNTSAAEALRPCSTRPVPRRGPCRSGRGR